ncbi:MAG: class I SAM-dependent methyltransferase [Acidobacteriota bacterium]|nr:class I SAM-dependent methyltransferase [Acidobacteriota bacterium]
MSIQLDHLPAGELAKELLDRTPAILRRRLAQAFRRTTKSRPVSAGANAFDRSVFANFTRDDGTSVPLWSGYRNRIKAQWTGMFWPARLLLHLDRLAQLEPTLREVATEIREARTLPLALPELTSMIHPVAMEYHDLVVPTGRHDSFVGATELVVVPERDQIRLNVEYNLNIARRLLRHFGRSRVIASRLRVLEQGCGSGYTTMALAAIGVGKAVGIDIDWGHQAEDIGWQMMRTEFMRVDNRAAAAHLEAGDAMALAFQDKTFDVVHSTVSLEHIAEPELALCEAQRVLRPGGIAYFEVEPWFGPRGGHSLCTLDFPWGHVRLSESEFESYLAAYRPHEARSGTGFYRTGFQSPRRTMGEIEASIVRAGFRILDWYESRQAYADHYEFLMPELLADCQRLNPLVTVRDLITSSYTVLASKA